MNNRLQFRHHEGIFDTRLEAIEYIKSQIKLANTGLAFDDKSYGFSLFAEPTILRYKNEEDESNPHIILAIGAATNNTGQYAENRFCIIDIDNTEAEIAKLGDDATSIAKALTIVTKESDSLKLYAEKTTDGTVMSGDVKVAETRIFQDIQRDNIIMTGDTGLFTYVDMYYSDKEGKIYFTVNGNTKEFGISDKFLDNGYYSKDDESLHLIRKDSVDITIPMKELIAEWTVEGDASSTPIVLTKEEIGYGKNNTYAHAEPWQDVLKADVRLDESEYNILKKTGNGRCLLVDGKAKNIKCWNNGKEATVQDVLDDLSQNKLSNDTTNILYARADGFYAKAELTYDPAQNQLTFKTSTVDGKENVNAIKLNSIQLFQDINYDPTSESIKISYTDATGTFHVVAIPIGQMLQNWEWDVRNDAHSVKLSKQRVEAGNDLLSADVKISDDENNILVERDHYLYVEGTADNIKYGDDSDVEEQIEALHKRDEAITKVLHQTQDDLLAETRAREARDEYISGVVDTIKASADGKLASIVNTDKSIVIDNTDKVNPNISVKIASTDGNMLVNTLDGLYVSNEKVEANAEAIKELQNAQNVSDTNIADVKSTLNAEVQRAQTAEQELQRAIDAETAARTEDDAKVYKELVNEVNRSTAKDNELDDAIKAEVERSTNKDNEFNTKIEQQIDRIDKLSSVTEVLRADLDNEIASGNSYNNRIQTLETSLSAEVTTRQTEDEKIAHALEDEIKARQDKDAALDNKDADLEAKIQQATWTVAGSPSVKLVLSDTNVLTAEVLKAQSEKNIITFDSDQAGDAGIYATVGLDYNGATNTLYVTNPAKDDAVLASVQLNVGSLVSNIKYDPDQQALIITYKNGNGEEQAPVVVPIGDLFNEWDVENLEENSAIHLEKEANKGEQAVRDVLTARVIINTAHTDNLISIDNNGLYVPGSGITKVQEQADAMQAEMDVFENIVLGQDITSGSTYQPNPSAEYISGATSVVDSINKIDTAVSETNDRLDSINETLNERIDTVSAETDEKIADTNAKIDEITEQLAEATGNTDCLDNRVKAFETMVWGRELPECGEGAQYEPVAGGVIESARSLQEATEMLDKAVTGLQETMETLSHAGETATVKMVTEEVGTNVTFKANAKLSHGQTGGMGDDELTIVTTSDPSFTDTNALRIVDLAPAQGNVDDPRNGLYLSNKWDCGEYEEQDSDEMLPDYSNN